jgi:short subunit dehydrogenase-like uncharacterized protein
MTSSDDIVVYGATGTTGSRIARALHGAGARVVLAGRDGAGLATLAADLGRAPIRVAAVDDPSALAAAFAGARVVVAAAGPFAVVGAPVLAAALAAGADYVDVAGEPHFVRAMYERHESAARRAGRTVVSGMAVGLALGDLAAARAAAACAAVGDDGPAVRAAPAARLAAHDPVDRVDVAHVLDDFSATPGSTRSTLETLAEPALIWCSDRWDEVPPGASSWQLDAGAALGGGRDAVSFPSGEVVTVPRHVAARRIETYVSWARTGWAMRAAGLAGRLAPLVARTTRAAARRLDPAPPPSAAMLARARFAIVARARRGADQATVRISGRDLYGTSALIAAWAAHALASRGSGPVGVLAPAEVFAPGPALAALAALADLRID